MRGAAIQSTHGLVCAPPGRAPPPPRPRLHVARCGHRTGPVATARRRGRAPPPPRPRLHAAVCAPLGAAVALVPWPWRAGGGGPLHHHGLVSAPPGAAITLRSDPPPPCFLPCRARSPRMGSDALTLTLTANCILICYLILMWVPYH
ncbi:hypothetical protein E2562_021772 [Oryza meyeriana var. granulata]|uniref:Uncharacterized protein n=1 Tax=Oryza meyeriana var. granulata TaxID=110450 RepID=A0A6G1EY27_9ORYZ|nr:hypothetical protein E2562_021772 [Oryza meyeriana var. granulata]